MKKSISTLYERLEQFGTDYLTDAEALSAITGISLTVLQEGISAYNYHGLIRYADLLPIKEEEKAKLKLVYSICQRIGKAQYHRGIVIGTSKDIGQLFISELQFESVEVVAIALLDSRNQLIKLERISAGTTNSAIVYQKDVVRRMVLYNASAVIIGHNHPSGVAKPSRDDIEITASLNQLLDAMSLRLLDHILVANNQFISLKEEGFF